MRPALVLLLSLALGAGLVACGGSGDDDDKEAQIEDVTERFQAAIVSEDAKAFCALLAPNDVEKLGGGRTDGQKECLVVWGEGRNPLFGTKDPELEIEELSFKGPYATATLANGGELGFAKEGGRWYVHLAPGPEQEEAKG